MWKGAVDLVRGATNIKEGRRDHQALERRMAVLLYRVLSHWDRRCGGKCALKAHEQGADGMQIKASHPEGNETAEGGEIRLNCGEGGSSTEATEYRGSNAA